MTTQENVNITAIGNSPLQNTLLRRCRSSTYLDQIVPRKKKRLASTPLLTVPEGVSNSLEIRTLLAHHRNKLPTDIVNIEQCWPGTIGTFQVSSQRIRVSSILASTYQAGSCSTLAFPQKVAHQHGIPGILQVHFPYVQSYAGISPIEKNKIYLDNTSIAATWVLLHPGLEQLPKDPLIELWESSIGKETYQGIRIFDKLLVLWATGHIVAVSEIAFTTRPPAFYQSQPLHDQTLKGFHGCSNLQTVINPKLVKFFHLAVHSRSLTNLQYDTFISQISTKRQASRYSS